MSITKESKEWLAALALVPEQAPRCTCGFNCIKTPDITPDLLYAILIAGLKRCPYFLNRVDIQVHVLELPLADGIIRAAASLQEAK